MPILNDHFANMDALPIEEVNDVIYASKNNA